LIISGQVKLLELTNETRYTNFINSTLNTDDPEKMMKRLVEFPLEDGSSMMVEVDEPEREGLERVSLKDGIEKAHETFEKSLERVRPTAELIIAKLRSLHDAPDEVEVSFGLNLSASAGVVLSSAQLAANYSVKLKWSREKPAAPTKK
jgi:hypothetical protein